MNKLNVLFCTAHTPHPDQILDLERWREYSSDTVSLTQFKEHSPTLYAECIQCPDNSDDIESLAVDVCASIEAFDIVILPIGSPAFMFNLSGELTRLARPPLILFSHSTRESVENLETGIKTSVFKHKHFIVGNA